VKTVLVALILLLPTRCVGQHCATSRHEAEYYATAYARHYGLPVEFVRAVIEQESGWHPCAVSVKGAVGLMQLMPATAAWLGVANRCDIKQNIAGGVRYLAWLSNRFHGDLRLVAAAYYAGEHIVDSRGLTYSNRDVVSYVASVRSGTERQRQVRSAGSCASEGRRR
jgi:soluble lytic murein transglycosylase-like protein